MNEKKIKILNAVLFYVIWWGCILGIKFSYTFLGPMLTAAAGAVHLRIIPDARKEIKLILYCGALAVFIEGLYLHSGLLSYEGYILPSEILPPIWIICIWMTLGATLNYSMFFLRDRWLLMVICGGIFVPACYFFAMKGGILYFNFSILKSILILSAVWACIFPLLYYINKRIYNS